MEFDLSTGGDQPSVSVSVSVSAPFANWNAKFPFMPVIDFGAPRGAMWNRNWQFSNCQKLCMHIYIYGFWPKIDGYKTLGQDLADFSSRESSSGPPTLRRLFVAHKSGGFRMVFLIFNIPPFFLAMPIAFSTCHRFNVLQLDGSRRACSLFFMLPSQMRSRWSASKNSV